MKKNPRKVIPDEDVHVVFFRRLNKTLRDAYKAYCSRRGISMRRDFINHMMACVEKDRMPMNTNTPKYDKKGRLL